MFINQGSVTHLKNVVKNVEKGEAFNYKQKHNMFLNKKICCRNKKSFVIYNMNNNSLIGTGNSGRGLVLYFVDFL